MSPQLVAYCVPTFKISLINAPCLIDSPGENYSKLLGISKNEQNHSLHSVSCLINKALRISSNDGNTITLREDYRLSMEWVSRYF